MKLPSSVKNALIFERWFKIFRWALIGKETTISLELALVFGVSGADLEQHSSCLPLGSNKLSCGAEFSSLLITVRGSV